MTRFGPHKIELLRALSEPLPLEERPFADIAARAGLGEEQVLAQVRHWMGDGTIRRFGARINHRSIGYTANGMSVWDVPGGEVDRVAECMVRRAEVSHCYLRPRRPAWPFNLYAMIHGTTEADVLAVARAIAAETDVEAYRVLFSTRELKKSAPRYFAEVQGPEVGGES